MTSDALPDPDPDPCATPPTDPGGYPWPRLVDHVEFRGMPEAVYLAERSARRHRATALHHWSTSRVSTDELRTVPTRILFESHDLTDEFLIMEFGEGVAEFRFARRTTAAAVYLRVSGPDMTAVRAMYEDILRVLPKVEVGGDDCIPVRFWTEGDHGPERIERRLSAQRWEEIEHNYSAETRRALVPLMTSLDNVAAGGRLLLWHGEPGTGKTFALRALARTHASQVSVDYILEPEIFFGKGAKHLTSVLDADHDDDGDQSESKSEKWRLLVLEDADELISADAKQRTGQGLARLLNLADGLFGQAFKLLILITTNEPITTFHPAITRPGRCGALVDFKPSTRARRRRGSRRPALRPRRPQARRRWRSYTR